MAEAKNTNMKASLMRRTKKEIEYEYKPILGRILGFWRKAFENKIGEDVILHIDTELRNLDRLFINDQEIPLDVLKKTNEE